MTTFGKVALVTGGAGGIGILICSEILKNKFVEVIRDELIIPSYLMNKKKRFFFTENYNQIHKKLKFLRKISIMN